MKAIQDQKKWVTGYHDVESAIDDLSVMNDFFLDGEMKEEELDQNFQETLKKVEDFEFKCSFDKEEDMLPAVLTINSGAGGTESQDWVSMLMRMYIMWGEKNKYKVNEIDLQRGDVAGIKSVTLEFVGDLA